MVDLSPLRLRFLFDMITALLVLYAEEEGDNRQTKEGERRQEARRKKWWWWWWMVAGSKAEKDVITRFPTEGRPGAPLGTFRSGGDVKRRSHVEEPAVPLHERSHIKTKQAERKSREEARTNLSAPLVDFPTVPLL